MPLTTIFPVTFAVKLTDPQLKMLVTARIEGEMGFLELEPLFNSVVDEVRAAVPRVEKGAARRIARLAIDTEAHIRWIRCLEAKTA